MTTSTQRRLRQALDVYGDLLVADAVYDVVQGRAEAAGAAMEAAAGLAQPPNLEVLATPRTGRNVSTTVVVCLPTAPNPNPQFDSSPAQVADPAVATWLEAETGTAANSAVWGWTVRVDDEGTAQSLTLADLGLIAADAGLLSLDSVHDLLLYQVNGIEVLDGSPGDAAYNRVRELLALLGDAAVPADLVTNGLEADSTGVRDELAQRLLNLINVGLLLRDELDALVGGQPEDQLAMLANLTRWGLVFLTGSSEKLDSRVSNARDALQARLDAAEPVAAVTDQGIDNLVAAIEALVAPDGGYPVLSGIPVAELVTGLAADNVEEWLGVNAMVRPSLAGLEAFQLGRLLAGEGPTFESWTNRPGDPWQMNEAPHSETGRIRDTRLVVAYGTPGILPASLGVDVAVGLIDEWSETIPDTDHTTMAAFGFDAPGARAPQAILLAVPPDADKPIDNEMLLNIIAETRQLAHARMATPFQLTTYWPGLPTANFPYMGNTYVSLDPATGVIL